ncbi:predicted protein [Histoplasma mississippiense (nom. inval.)]|uniref:predicted protein n=1 Tax=Ajellomyces capsulatus (strain NAm1 / WU24) TaxID=2059318 RepID=UPI000157C293|nr:predicted protein [Histoplasma mississippiense (nom. inval.)]EDN07417.1 predicted protein [Histoplasma mississippiense (nom. inval.)]
MPGHTSLPRGPEGTIYEASGFDDDLRIEIDPTKIKFIKELKTSEASSIFHVNYDGMPRVLKVFHNDEDAGKERMAKAVKGIQQIHSALVEHNDPYPKNIMIVPDDSERVVWIDFDVAITYPDSTYIGDREHGWIEIETRQIESVGVKLVDASDDIHFLFPCH